MLCSEFSCQIRWQLWEESSLICIHATEVMVSVLTICRGYCLPVTYSGIQFVQTTAYLFPQVLPKWGQPVCPCCFKCSVAGGSFQHRMSNKGFFVLYLDLQANLLLYKLSETGSCSTSHRLIIDERIFCKTIPCRLYHGRNAPNYRLKSLRYFAWLLFIAVIKFGSSYPKAMFAT